MDIKDIPIEKLRKFLDKNNIKYDQNDIYDKAFLLMKKNPDYYPIAIIEWVKAYNLIKSNIDINIKSYSVDDLKNLDENELIELSKLLTLKSPNRDHIINILRYIGKYPGKVKGKIYFDDIDYNLINKLYGVKLANFLKKYDFKIILVNEMIKRKVRRRIKTLNEGKQIDIMDYFIYPNINSIFKGPSGSFDFEDKTYGTILMNNGTLSGSSSFNVPFGEKYYYEKYGKELLTNDDIYDYENMKNIKYVPELEELLIQLNKYY